MIDSRIGIVAELDGQQTIDALPFPAVLSCPQSGIVLNDAIEWIEACRPRLNEIVDQHGAVIFRGFPVHTAEDFDRFVAAFDFVNFPYMESLSNAVRINRTERVFTANEAPSHIRICLHHEMAQTPLFPGKLFFYCEQPAQTGGATPLCRSDALFTKLESDLPTFAADCITHGLKYSNVMPPDNDPESGMGRSWQSTFNVATKEQVEQRLATLGYTWEWLQDGCLRATSPRLDAVRTLKDGRRVFFNQLIAAFSGWKDSRNDPSRAITFGDGSMLNTSAVQHLIELADELTFDLDWQAHDVVLIDNFLTMHGRRPFTGTRKVLASLAERHTVTSADH